MGAGITIPARELEAFIARIFVAEGGEQDEADAIATHLVDANLTGHDSHGVVRVPRYLDWVSRGFLVFGQHIETMIDSDGLTLLDGNLGFGQVIGREAVELGIEKASRTGLAVVALRRAGHLGRIGAWTERAVEAGLVVISFVNVRGSMLVAPHGGAERRMSTAPVSIGVPNPDGEPFILDFSTAKVAEGKALVALQGGKPLAEDSLIDANGQPTKDPSALYGEVPPGTVPNPRSGPGALMPLGAHKGSGLGLACELLAGTLTGSGTSCPDQQAWNGMLSIYIDPNAIDDGHGHADTIRAYLDYVQSAKSADPDVPVMIPGDPERAARKARLRDGVSLPEAVWQRICEAAEERGVAVPDTRA